MKQFSFLFLACAGIALSNPLVSKAQDPTVDTGGGPSRNFGAKGDLAISSDAALEIAHYSPGDVTRILLSPAVDWFVIKNLSIGAFISWTYITAGESDSNRFAIGPRVGYNIPLSDLVSIWPKVGFSFSTTSVSSEAGETDEGVLLEEQGNDGVALNIFVPIMFYPATHFFAGFGPFLDTDLSGDNKVTSFGGRLTLGGWFTP
ncbi:MAG TPA: hypothetical protein VJV78_09300 [Polyangiales bacterium]|nr:hypothetical protein [Polyangiales bacterium]